MIKTESYEINGIRFVKTYSDEHRYVVREGISYIDVNDIASLNRTYTEGDLIVDDETESEEYEHAGRILMGVDE